jgi:putative ABC transport system ATP-binding protein
VTLLLGVTGLIKTFGLTSALRGADLRVQEGEIVAIMGPSGSGKSTLLHCAGSLIQPDGGSVHYLGADLTSMPARERAELRRQEFGFVFQFDQLVPELTCLENVALPMRLAGARKRIAEATARDWLCLLQIEEVAQQRPGEVSGGEAQRVAIARAVINGPKILFADEPTGALDSLQSERVMTLLANTAQSTGAAIVLVTHDPQVAAYSDREVIIRDGRTTETELG